MHGRESAEVLVNQFWLDFAAPEMGPGNGPVLGVACSNGSRSGSGIWTPVGGRPFLHQALASWHWWHFTCGQVPSDKVPLRLNMDETAVRFYYEQRGGYRLRPCVLRKKHGVAGFRKASAAYKKMSITCMTMLSDSREVQGLLPQVLIGNEYTFKAGDLVSLRRAGGHRFTIWRKKSAWVNSHVMMEWLRLLSRSLRGVRDTHQPMLLMDAFKAHLSEEVLSLASDLNIWIILVPAQVTFLLQPLDTHVFGQLKQVLRRKITTRASTTGSDRGNTSMELVTLLRECFEEVIDPRHWGSVFEENGYGLRPGPVRRKILTGWVSRACHGLRMRCPVLMLSSTVSLVVLSSTSTPCWVASQGMAGQFRLRPGGRGSRGEDPVSLCHIRSRIRHEVYCCNRCRV